MKQNVMRKCAYFLYIKYQSVLMSFALNFQFKAICVSMMDNADKINQLFFRAGLCISFFIHGNITTGTRLEYQQDW